MNSVKIY